jgi:hypothetical protein
MNVPLPRKWVYVIAALGLLAGALLWNVFIRSPDWNFASDETPASVLNSTLVRISAEQYRQIISDVFGPSVQIKGRFVEPGLRADNLLAVGASQITVTSAGLEAADKIADGIATQVLSADFRGAFMPCAPRMPSRFDDECAKQFLGPVGRILLRRPLTTAEFKVVLRTAADTSESRADFYAGLQMALRNLLISPDFLFRRETSVPDPSKKGNYYLVGYSRASRLSFFLWNSTPDDQLLDAAAKGELETKDGLARQVDRMLDSRKLASGVRAFFVDLLGFDEFSILNKDSALFPQFTAQVASDAQEQTLRTITDLLLVRNGDYRDLFTTRRTFLTPSLGALYGVPLVEYSENGAPDKWSEYEFPAGDPRSGLLAQASFVALHSHPGRSSPTGRGKALRERLLCQTIPPPPGDVDFSLVADISNPKFKTARQRLSAHASQPACAGCHKITDPIGLALENFDGSGAFRTTERGVAIDTSGELNGVHFDGPVGLAAALHADPAIPACLVTRLLEYGTNRYTEGADLPAIKSFKTQFASHGYKLRALLRFIATDEAFYRAPRPRQPLAPLPMLTVKDDTPIVPSALTARQ